MSHALRRLWHSISVRIAVAAFIVFNINLRPISSADTFPTRYLPIALLTGHGFQLDQFDFLRDSRYPLPGAEASGVPYYLQYRRGHYLSTYPVMPAILAVPVYAVPVALGLTSAPSSGKGGFSRTEIIGTFLSKITASAAMAVSVALVYLSLLLMTDRRAAMWITLIYAFATSVWSVSSQGIWQTSFSGPLLAATLLCLLKARASDSRRHVVWGGVWVALAVACRPTVGIFALLFTLYVFRRHRQHFWSYLVVPTIIGTLLLAYNVYYFGNVMGGYTGTYVAPYDFSPAQIVFGTYGLLLSANRGLIVFSPILIFAFVGMGRALIRRDDALQFHSAVGVIATILFYSTFTAWYGTFSFSYRYLTDLLPMLVLFIPSSWDWITASPSRLALFATLAVYSVAIQIVGSFFYPCGWYRSPVRDPSAMARIFDWRDLEVVQCVRNGPVYPDGLRLLRPRPSSPGSRQGERPNER